MKKTRSGLLVTTTLISIAIFTGCHSSGKKEEEALAKNRSTTQDFREVQKDLKEDTTITEEWKNFRSESEERISRYEIRTAKLKEQMKMEGNTLDTLYAKRIHTIEQQNRDMKHRINAFERNKDDWVLFKHDFNRDMDHIGQELKELMVDHKK